MSKESWYSGKSEYIIRIDISDDFIVDYDKSRGMYRVSIFEDGHFLDEVWFDAYEEKECRKHGHWVLLDDCSNAGVYCSECHKKVYRKDYANQKVKSKFCPNCGSVMDGKFEIL